MQPAPVRSFFVIALLGVTLATIAIVVRSGIFARKDPGRPINSAMREALETPQFTAEDASIVEREFGTAHRMKSGLLYVVRALGEGKTPYVGARVRINYVGRFLNGKEFGNSNDRLVEFPVGTGKVIKGWDEALMTMKKGEKRTLIVPYWLGYGLAGQGIITPRATLIYEIQLVDFE